MQPAQKGDSKSGHRSLARRPEHQNPYRVDAIGVADKGYDNDGFRADLAEAEVDW
jgi:hypothetical protein